MAVQSIRGEQERIKVGPYTFIQAVQIMLHGNQNESVPIPEMFAKPGGGYVSIRRIRSWAKSQGYSVVKE